MSDKSLSMEMGNLVCRFGEEKVLLDMAEEIFLPCFTDDTLVRKYDTTSFFFHEVRLVKLEVVKNETVIGVVGRLIKDTTLQREQIFKRGEGLIQNSRTLRSSPSSMFLLILNNHRLVYVKETANAPSKESFRSTLLYFLRQKHKSFINEEYKNQREKRKEQPTLPVKTKRELQEEYPRPSLELIPLTSEDSIEQFIRKYSVLKSIEISLSNRNDENDNDPFFDELQKRKDSIGSSKSVVRHANAKGLNKDEAISEISEATEQGNQEVKLNGTDAEGDTLRGNNEQFQLKKPLKNLPKKPQSAAPKLYESFAGLVQDGTVKVPKTSSGAKRKIRNLLERIF